MGSLFERIETDTVIRIKRFNENGVVKNCWNAFSLFCKVGNDAIGKVPLDVENDKARPLVDVLADEVLPTPESPRMPRCWGRVASGRITTSSRL